MPFIIETTIPGCGTPCDGEPECERVTEIRRAVATLDEAQSVVSTIVCDLMAGENFGQYQDQYRAIDESGSTIGPLPDGTVIEVKKVEWNRLRDLAGLPTIHTMDDETDRKSIDAYNADHGSSS